MIMWFFDDENGNSITFNDYEDESENTVTYFIEKDDFTNEDVGQEEETLDNDEIRLQ